MFCILNGSRALLCCSVAGVDEAMFAEDSHHFWSRLGQVNKCGGAVIAAVAATTPPEGTGSSSQRFFDSSLPPRAQTQALP